MIGSYVQIVFYLVAILFVLCIMATVTTFREIPLKKAEIYRTGTISNAEDELDSNSEVSIGYTKMHSWIR